MNIPIIPVIIFVALSIFYYFTQKNRIRKNQRHAALEEKRQELMRLLQKRQHSDKDAQESDTTKAE